MWSVFIIQLSVLSELPFFTNAHLFKISKCWLIFLKHSQKKKTVKRETGSVKEERKSNGNAQESDEDNEDEDSEESTLIKFFAADAELSETSKRTNTKSAAPRKKGKKNSPGKRAAVAGWFRNYYMIVAGYIHFPHLRINFPGTFPPYKSPFPMSKFTNVCQISPVHSPSLKIKVHSHVHSTQQLTFTFRAMDLGSF